MNTGIGTISCPAHHYDVIIVSPYDYDVTIATVHDYEVIIIDRFDQDDTIATIATIARCEIMTSS